MRQDTPPPRRPQDPAEQFAQMEALGWTLAAGGLRLARRYPYGVVTERAPDSEDAALCQAWLVTHAVRRQTINPHAHSRPLAAAASLYFGTELPHGALIAAALALRIPFAHLFGDDSAVTLALGLRFGRAAHGGLRYLALPEWTPAARAGRTLLRRPRA